MFSVRNKQTGKEHIVWWVSGGYFMTHDGLNWVGLEVNDYTPVNYEWVPDNKAECSPAGFDLISRASLWSEIMMLPHNGDMISSAEVEELIKNEPAVEVEPVVYAHWVGTQYDGYADGVPVYDLWECSNCREEYEFEGDPPPYKRCPYCGAHMKEADING